MQNTASRMSFYKDNKEVQPNPLAPSVQQKGHTHTHFLSVKGFKAPFPVIMKLKGCVRYIFASLFLSLNESTFQTRKNVFISLQKLFSFSRKSDFKMLHFRIL